MKRSTETLSLVLIGSVIAMGGCRSGDEDEERNEGGRNGGGRMIGGAYMVGRALSGGRNVGGTPSVSSRGGFGTSEFVGVAG